MSTKPTVIVYRNLITKFKIYHKTCQYHKKLMIQVF